MFASFSELWAVPLVALGAVAEAPSERPNLDPAGAKALLTDLERIVTTTEAVGWYIDEEAYRDIHPTLLESVCRASVEARTAALQSARAASAQVGEPRKVFAEEGRKVTPRFEHALSLARRAEALQRALARADADCPFWETPRVGFKSRQTDHRSVSLVVETGGNIQLRQTAGSWTFGGGGLGRLLPSFGISERISLLFGVEFGGGAMLRPGSPETEFVVNYFPALPVLIRFRDVNWRYDLEVGPVGLFQADNTNLSYGARVGTAISVLGLRTRNVLPYAGVAGTYEYYFESGGRPRAHFVRGGLRVGILWDF
ncbi:MAG TPA: hypothetical protein VIM73_11995 [Polyangiaceae bacterium]